jgi:hypothetical protein
VLPLGPFLIAAAATSLFPRPLMLAQALRADPRSSTFEQRLGWAPDPLGLDALPPSDAPEPPPCVGEVCQPRVAVPGHDPVYSIRGKRTELAVTYLRRLDLEPVATVASWLAVTGVRLDFTPPQFEPGKIPVGHAGWGRLTVWLRWRLDANNTPVFWNG